MENGVTPPRDLIGFARRNGRQGSAVDDVIEVDFLPAGSAEMPARGFAQHQPCAPNDAGQTDDLAQQKQIVQ
jgi:hypothetical protein